MLDPEDVKQEAALLRLQGKNPKLSLLRKRMDHQEGTFDEVPFGASSLWEDPGYDQSVTDRLVEWALSQSLDIADRIFEFLEAPSDEDLPPLFKYLVRSGITLYQPKSSTQSSAQILLSALRVRPHDPDELVQIIRSLYPSKRPEALVRQFLRRYQKSGILRVVEDKVYLEVYDD
jgi:hypothetical protein